MGVVTTELWRGEGSGVRDQEGTGDGFDDGIDRTPTLGLFTSRVVAVVLKLSADPVFALNTNLQDS